MCAHSPTRLEHANPQKLVARWRAVANRNASANTFVYAVRTTGIYCRPSCPARLARQANVDFFDSPTLAEAAGFRSCKRCRPNDQMGDPQVQLVQAACDSIAVAVSSGGKVKLEELAEAANFTPSHFHRVFKKITGVTPGQYAKELNQRGFNGGESNGNLEHDGVPGLLMKIAFSTSESIGMRMPEIRRRIGRAVLYRYHQIPEPSDASDRESQANWFKCLCPLLAVGGAHQLCI